MHYRSRCLSTLFALAFAGSVCAHGAVTGHVRDGNADAVSGATVRFVDESGTDHVLTAVTDQAGQYTINMATGVAETRPDPFVLGQNYPNPFNPATVIPYSLTAGGAVNLTIYNIAGQKIATLVDQYQSAGSHQAVWDGTTGGGAHAASGLYFYRLTAGGISRTAKMTLLDGGRSVGTGVAGGGAHAAAAKSAAVTWRVTITGDDIETYEESGITLDDGAVLDFTVTRTTVQPLSGQYTMPFNIKETAQFFDFSTGESTVSFSSTDSWDVAFENQTMGLGIDLNFGKASRARNTGETDFAAVTLPDGLSEEGFVLDAPWNDTTAVAIDDWFSMPQMGVIVSKEEVYLIASNSVDGTVYHKFQITGYASGAYSFVFAELPGGETVSGTVTKGGDAGWIYYSFTEQDEVAFEPPLASWDLYFGPTYFVMGEMGYTAMGKIIPNNGAGVTIAVAPETPIDELDASDWIGGLGLMYEIPDWYTLSGGMPPTYEYPVQTFLVNTAEGDYGAFQVLSYKSAGVTGFPTFDFTYGGIE